MTVLFLFYLYAFYFFFLHSTLAKTSCNMLHTSGDNGYPFLVPSLKGKTFIN